MEEKGTQERKGGLANWQAWARDAMICLAIIYSAQNLMLVTSDDSGGIVPIITENPAFMSRYECANFKPLISQAKDCLNASKHPQISCSIGNEIPYWTK